MSKIQIEQVDSLDGERKVVRYGDLEQEDVFVRASTPNTVCIRTRTGYYINPGIFQPDDESIIKEQNSIVIPVKAKILWCREGGGE